MNSNVFRLSSSHGHPVLSLINLLGIAAMLMLFSASCATVGRDFPVSQVSDIRIGNTTQDEIRAMFGSPWRVGIEDGQRTWTYGKYCYRLFGEASTQDLVIRFDERNVVVSYTFNTTAHQE
jgi:outer membrane protein assembly factor BamE (lipoprotein component of BamABCDE complex)